MPHRTAPPRPSILRSAQRPSTRPHPTSTSVNVTDNTALKNLVLAASAALLAERVTDTVALVTDEETTTSNTQQPDDHQPPIKAESYVPPHKNRPAPLPSDAHIKPQQPAPRVFFNPSHYHGKNPVPLNNTDPTPIPDTSVYDQLEAFRFYIVVNAKQPGFYYGGWLSVRPHLEANCGDATPLVGQAETQQEARKLCLRWNVDPKYLGPMLGMCPCGRSAGPRLDFFYEYTLPQGYLHRDEKENPWLPKLREVLYTLYRHSRAEMRHEPPNLSPFRIQTHDAYKLRPDDPKEYKSFQTILLSGGKGQGKGPASVANYMRKLIGTGLYATLRENASRNNQGSSELVQARNDVTNCLSMICSHAQITQPHPHPDSDSTDEEDCLFRFMANTLYPDFRCAHEAALRNPVTRVLGFVVPSEFPAYLHDPAPPHTLLAPPAPSQGLLNMLARCMGGEAHAAGVYPPQRDDAHAPRQQVHHPAGGARARPPRHSYEWTPNVGLCKYHLPGDAGPCGDGHHWSKKCPSLSAGGGHQAHFGNGVPLSRAPSTASSSSDDRLRDLATELSFKDIFDPPRANLVRGPSRTRPRNNSLVLDSGCTHHAHPVLSDLSNFTHAVRDLNGDLPYMIAAGGSKCDIVGHGDLPIFARDENGDKQLLRIERVRCVPDFSQTLISTSQLWDNSEVEVRFGKFNQVLVPADGDYDALKLPFKRRKGLYEWDVEILSQQNPSANESIAKAFSAHHQPKSAAHIGTLPPDQLANTMHRRLLQSNQVLRRLPELASDVPESIARGTHDPSSLWIESNAQNLPHPRSSYKPSYPGRLVHADLVGPFRKSIHSQKQYALILIDDHSRFKTVYALKKKSDAVDAMKHYVPETNAALNRSRKDPIKIVGTLHTDNGGEFVNSQLDDFLEKEGATHTLSSPYVHDENSVAERAVRSIVELARALLTQANAPIGFWDFAFEHAADILNRTHGPPESKKSSYEHFLGERPRILPLLPFGCRAYLVKPRPDYLKSMLENRAYVGINLGRSRTTRNAYAIWVPTYGKVMESSNVYIDENLFPWRIAGDQRLGPAIPHAAPDDGSPEIFGGSRPKQDDAEAERIIDPSSCTVTDSFTRAVKGPNASASGSDKVLILYSGHKNRPDGLNTYLAMQGLKCELIDNHPVNGGGANDDILDDDVFERLRERITRGEFLAIWAAPPCSTFSIARFFSSPNTPKGDGGPRVLRDRDHIEGRPNLTFNERQEVNKANRIVERTALLLAVGIKAGTQFALEHPADRGLPEQDRIFLNAMHGPIWLHPFIKRLKSLAPAEVATFPMCAFGAEQQKYTTVMFSMGLAPALRPLNELNCTHHTHKGLVGGMTKDDPRNPGSFLWKSHEAAAYPTEFNEFIAKAFRSLVNRPTSPLHEVARPLIEQRPEPARLILNRQPPTAPAIRPAKPPAPTPLLNEPVTHARGDQVEDETETPPDDAEFELGQATATRTRKPRGPSFFNPSGRTPVLTRHRTATAGGSPPMAMTANDTEPGRPITLRGGGEPAAAIELSE